MDAPRRYSVRFYDFSLCNLHVFRAKKRGNSNISLCDSCKLTGQISHLSHGGTGVVFTMASSFTQLGFLVGPMVGSGVLSLTDFEMRIILGVAILVARRQTSVLI